jgi:hypothetical protein
MQFLSESERESLKNMLQSKAKELNTVLDERGMHSDYHLVFEALHVLADGIPERLYAMLHFKGSGAHKDANAGLTMLYIKKISDNGSASFEHA